MNPSSKNPQDETASSTLARFEGGGEMGALIRSLDWSKTPLGPVEDWSLALRMMVSFLLTNRFPVILLWGPHYVQIYNDPYRPVLGDKHPRALGQEARDCWKEIWTILAPLFDTPFNGGPATWIEDLELEIHRSAFTEETHFTVAYNAVPDDTAPRRIGGVLATVHEISEKVVSERRVKILRDVGARTLEAQAAEAKTVDDACAVAALTLADYGKDVPFALFYLIDGNTARLAASAGVQPGEAISPVVVDLDSSASAREWPLREAIEKESSVVVDHLSERFAAVPPGPWSDPPHTAYIVPIRSNLAHQLAGVLILGVSARLHFDERYRDFCELVAGQVAVAIANARAYEEERKRAEALAELDRAKTAFFSNVSHEFRTPLTLMLGPLEEELARSTLPDDTREHLTVVHRNSRRLQKLVNTLLDFSRIEAGRIQASYRATDLAAFTVDLASSFRAAMDKADLRFVVNCPKLPETVHVDRDMWEKIVLNLISNAFKFTLNGEITVTLRPSPDGTGAELAIGDTGCGIPAAELPHIFDRFHRVENSRGRSHEGSGIGLALVQELVTLHGGTISVSSELDRGSVFTVSIPFGTAHLPAEQIAHRSALASTTVGADVYVEEAFRWLPDTVEKRTAIEDAAFAVSNSDAYPDSGWSADAPGPAADARSDRVLIVDDNADMREYIHRLLNRHYIVIVAADGMEALDRARIERPDLILADVMMPRLDGFGLLKAVRADSTIRATPVILLSARAGDESRIEGLEAGADDYLTKPFTARELEARIKGALGVAKVRRENEEAERRLRAQFETLLDAAPLGVYLVDSDFRIRQVNPTALPVFGNIPGLIGRDFDEVIHILWPKVYADEVVNRFRHTLETGEPYVTPERIEQRLDRGVREYYEWRINRIPLPDGRYGVVCYFRDISRDVFARAAIAESEERLRFMAESMPQKIFTAKANGDVNYFNRQWTEFTGLSFEQIENWGWTQFIHPDDVEENVRLWKHSLATGEPFKFMHRFRRADGAYRWHLSRAHAMRDAEGKISMWIGSNTEIHEQKEKEEELRRANEDLEQFAYSASHDLQEPIRNISIYGEVLNERYGDALDARGKQYLGLITGGATRMGSLVKDLLAYTQSAPAHDEVVAVDATAVLTRALANLAEAIREAAAVVSHDPLPAVRIHEIQLQQLFQNLVGNAIKYRKDGETPRIHVSAARHGEFWRFAVQDNGVGIPPEYKEKIFGIFKRLHTAAKYSGTGIGLAICQKIAERNKGRIWVESEGEGKGATFYFTLPADKNPR